MGNKALIANYNILSSKSIFYLCVLNIPPSLDLFLELRDIVSDVLC